MFKPLQILGILALLHAAYSTYEWVRLHKLLGDAPAVRVPGDVAVEAAVGLVFLALSTVTNGVAAMVPEQLSRSNAVKTMESEEPYAYLETRPNFQDLVARRKEYLAWRREQSAEQPAGQPAAN